MAVADHTGSGREVPETGSTQYLYDALAWYFS
jgi:hypothetical protein